MVGSQQLEALPPCWLPLEDSDQYNRCLRRQQHQSSWQIWLSEPFRVPGLQLQNAVVPSALSLPRLEGPPQLQQPALLSNEIFRQLERTPSTAAS